MLASPAQGRKNAWSLGLSGLRNKSKRAHLEFNTDKQSDGPAWGLTCPQSASSQGLVAWAPPLSRSRSMLSHQPTNASALASQPSQRLGMAGATVAGAGVWFGGSGIALTGAA